MEKSMDFLVCLLCDGDKFKEEIVEHQPEVKGEIVKVLTPAFVCQNCGEILMNSKQMDKLRKAGADKYRENHGLLTSTDIVAYRKRFNLSQNEFAKYLKVGEASIKRWETYYVQDESHNELILLKCDEDYAGLNAESVTAKLRPTKAGILNESLPTFWTPLKDYAPFFTGQKNTQVSSGTTNIEDKESLNYNLEVNL